MNFIRNRRKKTPSVIIVSLIDVLLVVLIFLMVSTTFKHQQNSLRLALPSAKAAQPGSADPKTAFSVTVTTNFPFFFLGEKPVTFDQLQKELEAAVSKNPQLSVKIRADRQSPYGEVVRVIDAAKIANAGSIDAITEKPPKPQ